uniref:Helitron helicase-like domain-containing protein n=1 Tax=Anopheles atroparvus TaxID=41427 RepID=A0A182J957_ANOAO
MHLASERARRIQNNEATERRLERRRQGYAYCRAVETAEQGAQRLVAERARRARKRQQTTEATGQPQHEPKQALAAKPSRMSPETADQGTQRLAAEWARRARIRQQTTEAPGQPQHEPEQGPAAGPSRVQEPLVIPSPASASVEARPPETADQRAAAASPTVEHCGAQRWPTETSTICCNSFVVPVVLPAFEEPPTELFDRSAFMDNIRRYKHNSAFAFTLMGASVNAGDRVRQDETLLNGWRGPVLFRIQGNLSHRIGSLECPPDRKPAYAQLYYNDAQEEQQATFDARVNVRTNMFPQVELDSGIVAKIARILAEHLYWSNQLQSV